MSPRRGFGDYSIPFSITISSRRDFEIVGIVCELKEEKTCILTLKGCNSYSKFMKKINKNPKRVTELEPGKYQFDLNTPSGFEKF